MKFGVLVATKSLANGEEEEKASFVSDAFEKEIVDVNEDRWNDTDTLFRSSTVSTVTKPSHHRRKFGLAKPSNTASSTRITRLDVQSCFSI